MIESRFVVASPGRKKALLYLAECFEGSLLAQQLGAGFIEQGDLRLVTTSIPPAGVDYDTDWSKSSCTQWLVGEITDYLKLSPKSIVLFEDSVSSPSDPYLSKHEHPAFWCYQEKVFWPVIPDRTEQSIGKVMAWSGGTRSIAGFLTLPDNCSLPAGTQLLSHTEFQQMASSITRLVTDVFDGGGYLVWKRTR